MAKAKTSTAPAKPPIETARASSLRTLVILLAAASVLVYLNTLRNGFALDDFIVIKGNNLVTQGMAGIPELLTTPYHWGNFAIPNDLYRPLSLVMFAIEYQLFDGSPTPAHFINIALFAACVVLLFLFLDRLSDRKRTMLAFIAAMLFALHPIHTEVVANIKSRDELLCFFFAFLALNRYLKYADRGERSALIIGTLCYFLSLMSKETSITLAAVMPLVFFAYRSEHRKRSIYVTVCAIAAAAVFLTIRFSVLSSHNANNPNAVSFLDNMLVSAHSTGERMATAIYIMGYYIRLLLLPHPLVSDYSYNSIRLTSFGNVWVLLSLSVYVAMAVLGAWLLLRKSKSPAAFGLLFFIITISLFSNIPFLVGAVMAERFLFFASVGFCLLLALGMEAVALRGNAPADPLKNKTAIAILVSIGVLYGGMAIARNSDWQDNYTLYTADTKSAPNNSRLHYNLGTNRLIAAEEETIPAEKARLVQEGMQSLKNCLAIYPGYALAVSQLGDAYFKMRQMDSAELYIKRAIALDNHDTIASNNLAAIYFFANNYEKALETCLNTITNNPGYQLAYINAGISHQHLNHIDSAILYFHKATQINPNNPSPYARIAKAYQQLNVPDSAAKYTAIATQKKVLK